MSSTLNNFAKACAFLIYADNKIEKEEIESAKAIFDKYHLDANEGEKLIKKYLDDFIDASDDPKEEESDFVLGNLELEGIDSFEVLKDLALIIVSDGEICFDEVANVHLLAEAFGLDSVFSTIAILEAIKGKCSVNINLEENHD